MTINKDFVATKSLSIMESVKHMKPLDPAGHRHIAQWVKDGGVLIYTGKDNDPYQSVMDWWNTGDLHYKAVSEHLFETLGLTPNPKTGEYAAGKGKVYVLREEPKDFVMKPSNDAKYFALVKKAFETAPNAGKLATKNSFYLERGAYIIAAVMDESVSPEPLVLNGLFIDLFDPALPVLTKKTITTGDQAYLYNLARLKDKNKPSVLCGGSRIYDEVQKSGSYSFVAKGPIDTDNSSRIYLPTQPKVVKVQNVATEFSWDDASHTCIVKFENNPDGVSVVINY
jgi:hypothetical protein